ncbi:MAG TPA: hypothetical protein VKY85_07265 [Candidatus Angelobacter sp.]|nr:hypothetical protein [Candidatus Angelobacter sp.]
MRFRVWLTTEAPLAIARNRATGSQLETVRHIPGTSWRGSLAAAMIAARDLKEDAHLDPEFKTLFLASRVRFGDLRYGSDVPFPLSGRVCSHHRDHRMQDLLLCRQLGEPLPRTCGAATAGGPCSSKTRPLSGSFRIERGLAKPREPNLRVLAHTAISNESLRVREGQFHSSTVIERGTRFIGEAWSLDEQAGVALEKMCQDMLEIVVGRGSTRGQGLARLQLERLPEKDVPELAEKLRKLNAPFEEKGKLAFTVTFNSPCMVYDEWNFARPYIESGDLDQAAGSTAAAPFSSYHLVDWFSRLITIEGWNAQAGLPKTAVSAIAPGSAFLFMAEVHREQYQAEIERLANLLSACAAGIGERWEEGFGEARICDPIHSRSKRR